MVNYYKILGLENYASVMEVKHAYKTKIKLFHPDVSTEQDAEEMTRYLNLAKEQLDTEENKVAYDRQLKLAYLIEIKRLHTASKTPQKSYWRTLSKQDREEKLEDAKKLKIKQKYEAGLAKFPLSLRVIGLSVLLFTGLQIIFTHHFKQWGSADYFLTALGYLTFISAATLSTNEIYTYLLVKSIKQPLKYNYEHRIGQYFIITCFVGILLVEGLNIFRKHYLLNNHFDYTIGVIDFEHSKGDKIAVTYQVGTEVFRRKLEGEFVSIVRLSQKRTIVKYAKSAPIISELVPVEEANNIPKSL